MGCIRMLLSYIILAICAGGAIGYSYEWDVKDQFHYGSLAVILTYALAGLLAQLSDECNETVQWLHDTSATLIPALVLPCFVTEVWLKNKIYTDEVAYAFAVVGILTEVLQYLERLDQNVLDVLVTLEAAALAGAGYQIKDAFVMTAAACFAGAYIIFSYCRRDCEGDGEVALPSDFFNYILAVYTYCVLMSNSCVTEG